MAKINQKAAPLTTHEGAVAMRLTPYQQLRRATCACLLWENSFYESGQTIAERIKALVPQVEPELVSRLAIELRHEHNLRHVPLLVTRELARKAHPNNLVANTLAQVISRADELSEFLALYWQEGKQPLSKQVKKGLAAAFQKFDAYQLGKYNQDKAIKLRDVLFLVHAKPKDAAQAAVWKQLVDKTLPVPETWEKRLSSGEDKRVVFEDLMQTKSLGYLAALRNLRNMQQAGVDKAQAAQYLLEHKGISQVLPFRFIAAARAVPQWEDAIEPAMLKATENLPKLSGKTIILVDRSGSMGSPLSAKSDLNRGQAAGALAVLLREICAEVEIWWFTADLGSVSQQIMKKIVGSKDTSKWCAPVPNRRGFALAELLQPLNSGTDLGGALNLMFAKDYQRLIVLTDEQSATSVPQPKRGLNYMINVASYQNGVGYGNWVHIDGFSESVVKFIQAHEQLLAEEQARAAQ